jgi:hypothetical protein
VVAEPGAVRTLQAVAGGGMGDGLLRAMVAAGLCQG